MSKPWCYLLGRYGNESRSPSPEQIRATVRELYEENLPGMTEGDYDEHGAGSLRYGYDEGPMYVLEITRHGGLARLEEWADQDYENESCPMKETELLPQEKSKLLWNSLATGNIERVRAYFQEI
jgi:hypothetical protein